MRVIGPCRTQCTDWQYSRYGGDREVAGWSVWVGLTRCREEGLRISEYSARLVLEARAGGMMGCVLRKKLRRLLLRHIRLCLASL